MGKLGKALTPEPGKMLLNMIHTYVIMKPLCSSSLYGHLFLTRICFGYMFYIK